MQGRAGVLWRYRPWDRVFRFLAFRRAAHTFEHNNLTLPSPHGHHDDPHTTHVDTRSTGTTVRAARTILAASEQTSHLHP